MKIYLAFLIMIISLFSFLASLGALESMTIPFALPFLSAVVSLLALAWSLFSLRIVEIAPYLSVQKR